MSIYHVPGAFAQSFKKGEKRSLDFKKFDRMGMAVIGRDFFREFISSDGTYPIAYRSDDRAPVKIFAEGFQRRTNGCAKYPKPRFDKQGKPIKVTAPSPGRQESTVALRLGNMDLDTHCAVCVTLDFEIASLFPFDPQKNFGKRASKIYICKMTSWLEVYNLQKILAPHLAYAREVASLGLGAKDILGCVYIDSQWHKNGVNFSLGCFKVNESGSTKNQQEFKRQEMELRRKYKDATWKVEAPSMQTKKLWGRMDGPELFKHVETILTQLKGNELDNTITKQKPTPTPLKLKHKLPTDMPRSRQRRRSFTSKVSSGSRPRSSSFTSGRPKK